MPDRRRPPKTTTDAGIPAASDEYSLTTGPGGRSCPKTTSTSDTRRNQMFRAALALFVAALALGVSSNAAARNHLLAPGHLCPDPALSAPPGVQIDAMLCYHNYARRRLGVRVLRSSAPLSRSAMLKARWINACRRFTHTPCGHSLESAFSDVAYTRGSWSVGENLAWGSGSLGGVREMFAAWLRSPEHRRNILHPGWHEIGVARIHAIRLFGSGDVTLWVAHFGSH